MVGLLETSFAYFHHIREIPFDLRQQFPANAGLPREEPIEWVVRVVGSQR